MDAADTVILEADYQKVRADATAFAEELAACVAGDDVELPSLPDVVLKIRDALARSDIDLDRLAELAGSDPALAARIMKIANSTLFSRGSVPPADLKAAVVRLGSRMVRNTAIALAARQVFIGYGAKAIQPQMSLVWRHSLHVAVLCHLLLTVKRCQIPPDEGFLAGLLHEVGALFILLRSKDHAALWTQPEALQAVIDNWQSRLGGRIMEQWGFTEALTSAVRDHDNCSLAATVPVSLTEVVAIANFLSNLDEATESSDELISKLPDFGAFLLDNETLSFVLETARQEVDSLITGLGSGGGRQPKAVSNA
jgi:HD-like signal output (HDOD) protein